VEERRPAPVSADGGSAERGLARRPRSLDLPWARCRPARVARETILQGGFAPLMSLYTQMRVAGRERVRALAPPVVFVANHCSHLDTPAILRALPVPWRQRTAVAAAADYFYDRRWVANAVALAFNTVPIRRNGRGDRDGAEAEGGPLLHVDRVVDDRWNVLMFAEGTRSRTGALGELRPGAAIVARRHNVPIVPVRVAGTHAAMPPGQGWPRRAHGRRHRIDVRFGPAIWVAEDEPCTEAMARVRTFLAGDSVALRTLAEGPPGALQRARTSA
jgi:1-acyl-sn-glycerol-3-phosphate acyltransferase